MDDGWADRYARDGVAFPIRVLAPAEAAGFGAALEALAGGPAPHGRLHRLHESQAWAWDLVTHPCVVEAVARLLGPDVVAWGTLVIRKPPRDPGFVAWHQDGAYAGFLNGAPALSAWIALTDSTRLSGCLRVIPRSQERALPHLERRAPGNLLSRGQELARVDEREAVDIELHAGEMSLHHVQLVHGSRPNRSRAPRTGFIARYATPALAAGTPVVHARGARADHLAYVARPPA